MSEIVVVGAGYVGLVTGACLSELGHRVTCIEIDNRRLDALRSGELPIHEPGLDELVAVHAADERLLFVGDYTPVSTADFVFIAVPTPQGKDGAANTAFVFEAVRSVVANGRPGLILVVKSTVPVGTCDRIAQLPEARKAGIEVVSNPEFLRQGTAVQDFLQPDRVVIGAASVQAGVDVAGLYWNLDAPLVAVDRRSAELAKYTANALLATRISFMNEISHIAQAVNADIEDVARIVGMDRRIGPSFLKAGLGWGGSCFPKDVLALSSLASDHDCRTPILEAVHATNDRQRQTAAKRLLTAVLGSNDPVVAILGLAFKPDTDDVRGSPALAIASHLLQAGVKVRAHDPIAAGNARRIVPGIEYCADPYAALDGSDAVLLATEWREYLALDWSLVRETMRGNTLFDGRNVLNGTSLTALGFQYLSFGRAPASTLVLGHPGANGAHAREDTSDYPGQSVWSE